MGPQYAQLLETCSECGANVRIIASIEDPAVIAHILDHLQRQGAQASIPLVPPDRGYTTTVAPPQPSIPDALLGRASPSTEPTYPCYSIYTPESDGE